MVAPSAPEGGWKKWFLEHPYQRTKYPIPRSHNVSAVFYGCQPDEAGNLKPVPTPTYEYVEMWYAPSDSVVYANLNGGGSSYFVSHVKDPEEVWANLTERMFNVLVASEPLLPPTPPEPSGSGWDDFDWSI